MPTRRAAPTAWSALSALAVVLGAFALNLAGCADSSPEVDKAALYSPESLAQEFAFRYRALKGDAKNATPNLSPRSKTGNNPPGYPANPTRVTKTGVAPKAETKRKVEELTINDLLADIDSKANKIHGSSRAEIYQKMTAAISTDPSLSPTDKKNLTDLIAQLQSRS